jgi:hypothetical protein
LFVIKETLNGLVAKSLRASSLVNTSLEKVYFASAIFLTAFSIDP